jgi:uncharacterized repeat protein (TIGR03803 family)
MKQTSACPSERNLTTSALATLILVLIFSPSAESQQFSVLYNFPVAGTFPSGTLIADTQGNLYGLTQGGGSFGWGSVFELPASGGETVLYSFTGGADGSMPEFTSLLRDPAGNLYGVTPYGGASSSTCSGSSCGVIFRISAATGKEKVLYSFMGGADGSFPSSSLISDANGNFYGVAGNGGDFDPPCATFGCGVVYELSKTGEETVLYSFTGGSDGATPSGVLVRDSEGNLYGTAQAGGTYGWGVVFKLDPSGNETVLYSFTGGPDGYYPLFLVLDPEGNLYGTTYGGGDTSCVGGCGVLFEIDSLGNESTLFAFTGDSGYRPLGGLVLDSRGNLYGTTYGGGEKGAGLVFRVSKGGVETVLHSFIGSDGANPESGLLLREDPEDPFLGGYLYGTTSTGGNAVGQGGVAFRIKP